MKKFLCLGFSIVVLFVVLILEGCDLKPKSNEMTITTSSKKALSAFKDGRYLIENYQAEKAAEHFRSALSLDPDFALAYGYLAFSDQNVFEENFNKAISLMDKVSPGEQIFLQMFDNQRKKNGKEMTDNANALLELFPEDKWIPYYLGSGIYYNDDEKALHYLTKTIEIDKDFAPAYLTLGVKYIGMPNFPEAEKYLLRYSELEPDEPIAYTFLSQLYRTQGEFDKAIENASRIAEVDPGNASGYLSMGNCYIFTNEFEKARENFIKYYDNSDDITNKLSALRNYNYSYIFEGDMEGALAAIEKYRNFAEENNRSDLVIDSYRDQARVSMIFNDLPKAGFYLEKAEESIKTSELGEVQRQNYLFFVPPWRGFYYTHTGDYIAAEKELETFRLNLDNRQMPGTEDWVNQLMGFLKFKQEKYDEALDLFIKVDDNPFCWYYTGEIYDIKGDKEKAKEYFEKVANYNLVTIYAATFHARAVEKLKTTQTID